MMLALNVAIGSLALAVTPAPLELVLPLGLQYQAATYFPLIPKATVWVPLQSILVKALANVVCAVVKLPLYLPFE
jgi:hypothetical protein